jgi:hypothetical protein
MLRRGQEFGRIGIGVPYMKANYFFFRWWSVLLARGLQPEDALLNSMAVPGEMPIPTSHNALVREFLRWPELDTLCIVEDDHVADDQVINRMRYKPENWAFDIVCASYPSRRGDWMVVGCNFQPEAETEYGEHGVVMAPGEVAETGTQEYDCAALGLVLIRRWVLEAMQGYRKPEEMFWFDWRGRNSQDIRFYWDAKQVGARVGVDRDNDIGHVGQKIYTMREFYQKRAEQARKEAKNG